MRCCRWPRQRMDWADESKMSEHSDNRELTPTERHLVDWMLKNGLPEARVFLPQLDFARVTSWHCPCGCACINFSIEGQAAPTGGLRILSDFLWGSDDDLNGIFLFQKDGILSGIEVYGLSGDAPQTLPVPEELRPFSTGYSSP